MTTQIKSKQRVVDHGEVFTAEREVKAMCDLVKSETKRIDSRFLEPACGNGNFLAEVLSRKLSVVKSRYKKSPVDYERYSFLAVSSIYGVDILEDNAVECRERLYSLWLSQYKSVLKKQVNEECCKAVRFVIEKNILCGDALTLQKSDGTPIIFPEWNFIMGDQVKRRDFALDGMLQPNNKQMNLTMTGEEYEMKSMAFIPVPVCEYPLTEYWRVHNYD